jgi:hypothetical protein
VAFGIRDFDQLQDYNYATIVCTVKDSIFKMLCFVKLFFSWVLDVVLWALSEAVSRDDNCVSSLGSVSGFNYGSRTNLRDLKKQHSCSLYPPAVSFLLLRLPRTLSTLALIVKN